MRAIILVLAVVCIPFFGMSTLVQGTHGTIYTPSGGSVTPSSMSISSSVANDSPLSFQDITKKGVITFGVDHHYPRVAVSGTTKITLQVSYHTAYGGSLVTLPNFDMQLTYDPTGATDYEDKMIKEIDGVVDFTVTVVGVSVNGSPATLPANLYINADLFINRMYAFNTSTPIALTSFSEDQLLDTDCDGKMDQLLVEWTKIKPAEEYELEWTFVNDYTEFTNLYKNASDVSFDFKNNSTRIVTTDDHYKISLIYDHGYVVYRLRAVGRSSTDYSKRIFGVWTTQDKGTISNSNNSLDANDYYFNTIPWEGGKNWQYTASFAEEGKRKEVVSFFDGTLRNRQMVTITNSNDKAIVGETIYDHMGRPAVQVLPVPAMVTGENCSTGTASLKYYNNFNVDANGAPYNRGDFDVTPSESCSILTAPMGNSSGAARYYSPANTDQTAENAYIPNSFGYPFSRVEYTPDNTGRVRREGGVGQDFQLSTASTASHETKMYYGHPEQLELDRLFGVEVGYASHYQKSMMIDQNGQVSISYMDQEGRVIATSLAGEGPANLLALDNEAYSATSLTAEMITSAPNGGSSSNVLSEDGKTLSFSSVILVSTPGTMQFDYTLDLRQYIDECIENICFNCAYDLSFEIKDECNVSYVPSGYDNQVKGVFTTGPNGSLIFNHECSDGGPQDAVLSFTTPVLPVGSYTVTKTLTLNEEALAQAEAIFMDPEHNPCIKTLEDFVTEYDAAADYSGCDPNGSCQECLDNLGTLQEFLDNTLGTEDDYNDLVDKCNEACEPVTLCDVRRDLMLTDVRPNGQYGEYRMPDNSIHPENFPLSVYNTNNKLPKSYSSTPPTLADWQTPRYELGGSVQLHYFTDNLTTIAKVEVQPTAFNALGQPTACIPAVTSPQTNVFPGTNGGWYTEPQYLTNAIDFINAFKPSWAYSLLYYHPEYNMLRTCYEFTEQVPSTTYNSSEEFDQLMQSTDTWSVAVTRQFVSNLGVLDNFGTTSGTDPIDPAIANASFYDGTSPNLAVMSQLSQKLTQFKYVNGNWYSMAQISAFLTDETFGSARAFGSGTTDEKNSDWTNFKSLYYSTKQQLIMELSLKRSVELSAYTGYNACIGNSDFNFFEYDFLQWSLSDFWNSELFNNEQPCWIGNQSLYAYKAKRFTTGEAQNMSEEEQWNLANYNMFELTGDCPTARGLEMIIDRLASENNLTSSNFSLLTIPEYTTFAFSLQNPIQFTSPLPDWDWQTTLTTSTQLSANLVNQSSAIQGSINIVQTGAPILWTDVSGFRDFQATGTGGLGYTFTAKIEKINGNDVLLYHVTGSTTFNVNACSFDEVCSKTDLGSALYLLFSGLVAEQEFASTSGYDVRGGSATLSSLVNNRIQLELSSTGGSTETWTYDNNGTFVLSSDAAGSTAINFGITSTVPANYTTFSAIDYFTDFEVMDATHFTLIGMDGSQEIRLNFESSVIIGSCGLPSEISCTDQESANFTELEALITDVLLHQDPAYDLFESPYLTANLISQMEPGLTTATSSVNNTWVYDDGLAISPRQFYSQTQTVVGNVTTTVTIEKEVNATHVLTWTITEVCTENSYGQVSCTLDDNDPPTSEQRTMGKVINTVFDLGEGCSLTLSMEEDLVDGYTLQDVVSIQSFETSGEADEFGNYHDFIIEATFDNLFRKPAQLTIFGSSCFAIRECTEGEITLTTDPEIPTVEFVDPCAEQLDNMTNSNAANAYYTYIDAQLSTFRKNYIEKCMDALESLSRTYSQGEYHYTLYYYDQAGNLVKTIPPAGVEQLPITGSLNPLSVQIASDRNNNTQTVTTTHRLATVYQYNSLNQLIAQHMPDMDNMNVQNVTLANGLHVDLVTTAIQMVSSTNGYLAGYVTNSNAGVDNMRGYLYKSTDGGLNWTRITNLMTSDLVRVKMVSSTTGFAVGNDGTVFRTVNNGDTWDLLNIHSLGIISNFVDVAVKTSTSAAFLLADGRVVKYSGPSTAMLLYAPTYSGVTNVSAQSISDYGSTSNSQYFLTCSVTSGSDVFTRFYNIDMSTTGTSPITIAANNEVVYGLGWNAIDYATSTVGIIGGTDGDLVQLAEGSSGTGTQMLRSSGSLVGSILETVFYDKNAGFALINNPSTGTFLNYTTDGGETWTQVSSTTCASICTVSKTSTSVEIFASYNNNALGRYSVTSSGLTTHWSGTVGNKFDKLAYRVQSSANRAFLIGTYGTNLSSSAFFSPNNQASGPSSSFGTTSYASMGGSGVTALRLKVTYNTTNGDHHAIVLRSDNVVVDVYTSGSTTVTNISPASTNFRDISVGNDGTNNYVIAYDQTSTKIHRSTIPNSAVVATLAQLANNNSLPSSTFVGLGLHNNMVTLISSGGDIYSSSASVAPSASSVTWVNRSDLRLQPLRDVEKAEYSFTFLSTTFTYSGIAVGENGTVFRRGATGASPQWTLNKLGKFTDLNAVSFATVNSSPTACIVGDNATAVKWLIGSIAPTITTITTSPVTTANFMDVALVPVSTNGTVYMVDNAGYAYYTANITAASPSLAASTTASFVPLKGVHIAPSQSGTIYGVAVGGSGNFFKLNGTTMVGVNESFGPRINSLHFASSTHGTVVGDYFFVRTTTNSTTWTKVLPQTINATMLTQHVTDVNTYLTTNGSHFALLAGPNYLTKCAQNTVTNIGISGTVNDIAMWSGSTTNGYLAVNATVVPFTLSPSGSTNFTYTPGIAVSTGVTVNALYAFPNGGVVAVGNGYIGYKKVLNVSFTNYSYGITANLKDVYFTDLTTGYIVGNAGAFYKTTSVLFENNSTNINGISWEQKQFTDAYVNTYSNVNINAIAFAGNTKAVWGGNYNSFVSGYSAYVRLLTDESNIYSSKFYYDRLGRIVASQNSRQQLQKKYSYALYDKFGRAVEAGEKTENGTSLPQFASIFGTIVGGQVSPTTIDDSKLSIWLNQSGARNEVTRSYYDQTVTAISSQFPVGLTLDVSTQRKRIVHITYEEVYDNNAATYDHATHYDYDIHGNVRMLLQDNKKQGVITDISQHRFKKLEYVYDLISGSVHRVDYESGKADQWHHAYEYDADNKLINVFTSTATPIFAPRYGLIAAMEEPTLSPYWDRDAVYKYYNHGHVAKTILGDQEVQGMDFVYTLHGWVKSVNSNNLAVANDPGKDGLTGAGIPTVAPDIMGYSLHYFTGDYASISSSGNGLTATQTSSDLSNTAYSKNLYNGNIARMVSTIVDPNVAISSRVPLALGNTYLYDQLNRLKQAYSFTNLNVAGNSWTNGGTVRYANQFTYDPNGNIATQVRRDENGVLIDDLSYGYEKYSGGANNGKLIRNRLYHVTDAQTNTAAYLDDIDIVSALNNQSNINTANNFSYDAEGRLIKDVSEQIANIVWRVDGKVKEIVRTAGSSKKNLKFDYDGMGRRIAKHQLTSSNVLEKTTYYVLDAQGNTMAVYEREVNSGGANVSFKQVDKYIYGSERIGDMTLEVPMLASQNNSYSQDIWRHTAGKRSYEMTNHLGNVLAVISDKLIRVAPNSTPGTAITYYAADILQSTDYSPFGVSLRLRDMKKSTVSDSHRYGFQGMEADDEVKGEGNSYDFGARMLDPRIGRWLTIDPFFAKYPGHSSYVFVVNSPIVHLDPDGKRVRPTNQGAADAMKLAADKLGAANFAIRQDSKTGLIYQEPDSYREVNGIGSGEIWSVNNFKAFSKRMKASDKEISKEQIKELYIIYLAITDPKDIEVQVSITGTATQTNTTRATEDPNAKAGSHYSTSTIIRTENTENTEMLALVKLYGSITPEIGKVIYENQEITVTTPAEEGKPETTTTVKIDPDGRGTGWIYFKNYSIPDNNTKGQIFIDGTNDFNREGLIQATIIPKLSEAILKSFPINVEE